MGGRNGGDVGQMVLTLSAVSSEDLMYSLMTKVIKTIFYT